VSDPVFSDIRVTALIELALHEDLGEGDRTSESTVPAAARARGRLLAKEALVVCGLPILPRVFHGLGDVAITSHAKDGDRVEAGTVLAHLEGPARALLGGERLVLNFLQHLSGVATLTRAYVDEVRGTRLVVRDTRKTVPGLRVLEKYAVRCGGGTNHRMGLDDAILVKDNHLALGGGDFGAAVRAARARHPRLPLEVEARTIAEVERAVAAKPDLILLDNMTPDVLREAVRLVAGRVPLEASGGITRETLRAIADTGVDFVAIGALTHSARAVDISLKLEPLRS
jgi:nicotinate-nucleotide pyrophosphorylase (carboxylating)